MEDFISEDKKWEFGSLEWCEYAGELGKRLLETYVPDLSKFEWGFSEEYPLTPERLMAGREKAGFYFMISGGKVTGGAGLPADCLALPGFHAVAKWASIAHASSVIYDLEGQGKRGAHEKIMWQEIREATGTEEEKKADAPNALCVVCGSPDHERPDCPVWPPGIGEALSVDAKKGGGLHNLTAKHLKHSPELIDLPKTEWGVPILARMTEEQKSRFLTLLGY